MNKLIDRIEWQDKVQQTGDFRRDNPGKILQSLGKPIFIFLCWPRLRVRQRPRGKAYADPYAHTNIISG